MAGVVAAYIAQNSGAEAQVSALGGIAEMERLAEEREHLMSVRRAAEHGELAPRDVPSDIHTYFGRIHKITAKLDELAHDAYDRAMEEVRSAARQDLRARVAQVQGPESLAQLQAMAQMERGEIRECAVTVEDAAISPWLSNDDYVEAYRQGGHSELTKWYWEQKREHGFGKEANQQMELENIFIPTCKFVLEQRASLEKDLKRAIAMLPMGPNEEVYAQAATNHFRGRATEWNSWRAAIVDHTPALEKDLPAALQVDEIQVRRQMLEREQTVERSQAVGL